MMPQSLTSSGGTSKSSAFHSSFLKMTMDDVTLWLKFLFWVLLLLATCEGPGFWMLRLNSSMLLGEAVEPGRCLSSRPQPPRSLLGLLGVRGSRHPCREWQRDPLVTHPLPWILRVMLHWIGGPTVAGGGRRRNTAHPASVTLLGLLQDQVPGKLCHQGRFKP